MAARAPWTRIAFLFLRFLVLAAILTPLWWLLIPAYGYALVQVGGILLRTFFGVAIEAGRLDAHGVLNTDSLLVFVVAGREKLLPIALLVTNMAPYLALVMATPSLSLARRLRILAIGASILAAGHLLFIVLVFRFQEVLQAASEAPTAIIQFYLTLPFLLWIVLAYWDRIGAYLNEDEGAETSPDA